jgi:argininosuccinate lyase
MLRQLICKVLGHRWSRVATTYDGVDYEPIGVGIQRCTRCPVHRHVSLARMEDGE